MEFLLALIAVAIGLGLARRGILHPGDYLVAASLAVMLAAFVLIVTPSGLQSHGLVELGAPRGAVARADFLVAHGMKIVLSSILFALGASAAAIVRRRATPERFA